MASASSAAGAAGPGGGGFSASSPSHDFSALQGGLSEEEALRRLGVIEDVSGAAMGGGIGFAASFGADSPPATPPPHPAEAALDKALDELCNTHWSSTKPAGVTLPIEVLPSLFVGDTAALQTHYEDYELILDFSESNFSDSETEGYIDLKIDESRHKQFTLNEKKDSGIENWMTEVMAEGTLLETHQCLKSGRKILIADKAGNNQSIICALLLLTTFGKPLSIIHALNTLSSKFTSFNINPALLKELLTIEKAHGNDKKFKASRSLTEKKINTFLTRHSADDFIKVREAEGQIVIGNKAASPLTGALLIELISVLDVLDISFSFTDVTASTTLLSIKDSDFTKLQTALTTGTIAGIEPKPKPSLGNGAMSDEEALAAAIAASMDAASPADEADGGKATPAAPSPKTPTAATPPPQSAEPLSLVPVTSPRSPEALVSPTADDLQENGEDTQSGYDDGERSVSYCHRSIRHEKPLPIYQHPAFIGTAVGLAAGVVITTLIATSALTFGIPALVSLAAMLTLSATGVGVGTGITVGFGVVGALIGSGANFFGTPSLSRTDTRAEITEAPGAAYPT